MMTLQAVLIMMCIVFGVIGAMRGWAKEILVVFSLLLAIFIVTLLDNYVPPMRDTLKSEFGFILRLAFIVGLGFFGYQTPGFTGSSGKLVREKAQDLVLGFLLGAINGYLLFGTLWYYLHQASYPLDYVRGPEANGPTAEFLKSLPPELLRVPYIYFAVGIAFIFVIVVFV